MLSSFIGLSQRFLTPIILSASVKSQNAHMLSPSNISYELTSPQLTVPPVPSHSAVSMRTVANHFRRPKGCERTVRFIKVRALVLIYSSLKIILLTLHATL